MYHPASLKSKFSAFTQSTAPSLWIPIQERNQSWKHAEKGKPNAREEHKKGMVRARETIWEGRLRKGYGVWNPTETSRSCILKASKPPGMSRGWYNVSACSSEPQKIECGGWDFSQTTTVLEEGIDMDLHVKSWRDIVDHKRMTSPTIHPTKTPRKGRPLGVVKSKRSVRKARLMGWS